MRWRAHVSTHHPLSPPPECSGGVTSATGVTGAAGGAACGGQQADGDACHPAVKSASSVAPVCLSISFSLSLWFPTVRPLCYCAVDRLRRATLASMVYCCCDVESPCDTETDRCSSFYNSHEGHQRLHLSLRMTLSKNKHRRGLATA